MNKNELVEYGDYLLSVALAKLDNLEDARDLVSETMLAAIAAIEKGAAIDSPKNYLYGVLNHKLMDKFRYKYSRQIVYYGILPDFEEHEGKEKTVLDELIDSQEAEKIHECLSKLTANYRQVLVRYYFYGQKIKQIADDLNLNENTVKFRLSYGRMNVKENLFMENYEKQSYDPEQLTVGMYGGMDLDGPENAFFMNSQEHILDQNIMILAYEKPVTIEELSKALGVSAAFIEPVVNKLEGLDFMKRTGNKVYTDFIIADEKDCLRICRNDKKVAGEMYDEFWKDMENVFEELSQNEYYKNFTEGQKRNFKQFAAIFIMQSMTFDVKNKKFPDFVECRQTEENCHKGWWGYAYGNRSNPNLKTDWSSNGYVVYKINGCFTYPVEDYRELKRLGLASYDLSSGRTFTAWWGAPKYLSERDFLKCCYAIYSGHEEEIPEINKNFLEDIEHFVKCNILRKEGSRIVLNVPVLKNEDDERFEKYLKGKAEEFAEKYYGSLEKLFDEKINYPEHIKGIPEFIQYQQNGSYFPMAMMYMATGNNYLAGENLGENPVPAMYFFVYEK